MQACPFLYYAGIAEQRDFLSRRCPSELLLRLAPDLSDVLFDLRQFVFELAERQALAANENQVLACSRVCVTMTILDINLSYGVSWNAAVLGGFCEVEVEI